MKQKLFFVVVVASLYAISAEAQFTTHSLPGVFARAVIPSNLHKVPYKVWAPNGDPQSPAQWQHTEFASSDNQVTFSIDTFSNSLGKTISQFYNDEPVQRAQGGDHINYSVLKSDWYVISGTNSRGYEFYKKFYALPKVNIAQNYYDYVPGYWVSFNFVYPFDQRKKYDPMVGTIANGFDPGTESNFGP